MSKSFEDSWDDPPETEAIKAHRLNRDLEDISDIEEE